MFTDVEVQQIYQNFMALDFDGKGYVTVEDICVGMAVVNDVHAQ